MKKKISVLLLTLASIVTFELNAQESVSPALDSQIEKTKNNREALEQEKEAEGELEAKAKAQHEAELKELDAIRDAQANSTEYKISPGNVELVVELDPKNYGFRTRNFRSVIGTDFDLLFRGRGMLHYDYRFFEYFTMVLHAGVDWSQVSLYEKFRQNLSKPAPKQFSVLAGVSGQWRLTEWYLRSAIFLEPSVLIGHMWQQVLEEKSTHWRIRPGLFAGIESVFDSGLAMTIKAGVEFPIDFAKGNAFKELAEPLMMFGLGLAI